MIQTAVLNALTEIGDETQLMYAALDSEESVALRCIQALSSRRVALAIPLLGELLANSDQREVRRAALVALGNIGVGDYEEIVVGAINDLSGFVRSEAARVVARAKLTSAFQVLLGRLDEESYPDVIVELVRALLELNTDRDLHHAQALLLHARPEVRAAAVEHWPWEESDTLKAILRNHLSDDDWQVRLSIVEKLASQTPDSMLREDFTQALSDPHPIPM